MFMDRLTNVDDNNVSTIFPVKWWFVILRSITSFCCHGNGDAAWTL